MSMEKVIKIDNFSDRLRETRRLKGWGQQQLAEKLNISVGAVGNWEAGPKMPNAENLGKIASLLGVTTRWLIYGDETIGGPRGSMELRDSAPGEDLRAKCHAHFERFLATCTRPEQLGWAYYELLERFPLEKFQPRELTEAQQIAQRAGERYDREHPEEQE